LNAKKFDWEGSDYRLKTIKTKGGICTDQSYYTSEVAKAKGVPAFIFSGAGSDGFHAWTAYMQKSGSWNFGVGRYENARFVTGTTIDPQTWETATDHQLNAMREGFRNGPKYILSEIHSMFATYFYNNKEYKRAEDSAKKSIVTDQRNTSAWETLIASLEKQERSQQEIIKMYESAIKAFTKYPDIDIQFRKRCIQLYLSNGNKDMARRMSSSIIIKTKANRPDIAMEFARRELEDEIKNGTQDKIVSTYKRLLSPFKSDPAMLINGLTIPIINSVINTDKFAYANDIIKVTRQIIKSKDETIKANLDNIEAQVSKIISKKQ
jgi:tetratricopeptide (TPR) repeat protein